uniref:LanC-like protein 2 n=1 Tax=Lygus hesperus TaxID=30085 RepID=A0A0A9VWB6_LYGHE
MVLCSNVIEETELYNIVRPTLEYLIDNRSSRGNFPALWYSENDMLVQWCHGAPGFVQLFIKASEVVDPSYMNYAIEAAEVVWNIGLLTKGYTLCHGVAGNAYSFLALFRKTGDRKHLLRATGFIEWCLTYPRFEREEPDRPYSLLKGYTGLLYFFTDVKDISTTSFPGYEL